ncbi:hypothetical protein LOTGIDRAFT_232168, partial [Lottia gigantea]
MDIMLDNGNTVKICTVSNTLDYAKAQPRKPMKMPLPPLPNSSAPALPPRRGAPPPPPPQDQDEYDEFSFEADEEDYDEFDVENKSPPKPAFKPPAPPTEPDEYYDEFAVSESPPSGPSIYMMGDTTDEAPPPPPPPSFSGRPKLSKPPANEIEYMDPDEDENISAGSHSSTGSSGPPVPGNRKPELPSRVEKPKKAGQSIFTLDTNTLTNVKSRLKNVGFNKKPEKKNDEEKQNIFGKALKPEKNILAAKPTPPIKPPSQTSNLKNKFFTKFSSKPKDMPPVPPIPDLKIDAFQSNESHSHHSDKKLEHNNSSHHEDQIDHSTPEVEDEEVDAIYDDATSQLDDPLLVHKWYHGLIDREESNKRLKSIGSDGTFLVRQSTKENHPCTLAVLYQNH